MNIFENDNDYFNEKYENIRFSEDLKDCNFKNVTFEKVDFSNIDLSTIYFEKCEFINCDFTNAVFSKYINKNNIYKSSKLLGVSLIESHLDNVTFEDSIFIYSNFSDSKLNKVDFKNCNLSNTSFMSIKKLNKVKFINCDLSNTDFLETDLNKLDLRTCNISGIRVSLNLIRGLIVTSNQAVSLSTILGINVKEEGEDI